MVKKLLINEKRLHIMAIKIKHPPELSGKEAQRFNDRAEELAAVAAIIKKNKDIEREFQKIINKRFWDML